MFLDKSARPCGYNLRAGFTLIELLIVVLIIGVLVAVALPQYQSAVLKSRYAQLQIAAEAINQSVQRYRMANGTDPQSFDVLDIGFTCAQKGDGRVCYNTDKNYYCTLGKSTDGTSELVAVFCQLYGINSGNEYLDYLIAGPASYLKRGGRYCRARGDAMLRVCASLGGVQKEIIANDGGDVTLYELP